jgi:hypothetical protein
MRHFIFIFTFLLALTGCSSIGNKIIYRSSDPIEFQRIGYVNSEYDTVTNGLFPLSNALFTSTVNDFTITKGNFKPNYLNTVIAYDNIDTLKLKRICKENDFDVILLTKLYFISNYFVYKGFLNIKPDNQQFLAFTNSDVCVEMKLFDKYGKLLIFVSYNTPQGNGTANTPKEGIVKGVKGGLTEIFSAINGKK